MEAALAFDALACEACGAMLSVEHGHRTARCPYCAAPAVVERPAGAAVEPTFVLGFVITRERALEIVKRWKRSRWFVPTRFARADPAETRGIYVPAYLHTATAAVDYSASIGENYTVVETYTTTNSKGQTVTRTRTKTKTEWRPLSGHWSAYLDDNVVTASRGLANVELEAIEPFDFRALRRFTPKLLSGWIAEDPSMDQAECAALAHDEACDQIKRRLNAFMPGDSHRALQFDWRLSNEDLELMLVPVWVLAIAYHDEKPPVRVVINGQTGQLAGRPPRSAFKIVATVLGVLAAFALVYAYLWRFA